MKPSKGLTAAGIAQIVFGLWAAARGSANHLPGEVGFGWVVAIIGLACWLLARQVGRGADWARGALMWMCGIAGCFWALGAIGHVSPLMVAVAVSCVVTARTAWQLGQPEARPSRRPAPRPVTAEPRAPAARVTPDAELRRLEALRAEHRYYDVLGASSEDPVFEIQEKCARCRKRYQSSRHARRAAEIFEDACSHLNSEKKKMRYPYCMRGMETVQRRVREKFRGLTGRELPADWAQKAREDAWRECWQTATAHPEAEGQELELLIARAVDRVVEMHYAMMVQALNAAVARMTK
jgi:hypothetical protein